MMGWQTPMLAEDGHLSSQCVCSGFHLALVSSHVKHMHFYFVNKASEIRVNSCKVNANIVLLPTLTDLNTNVLNE